MTQFTNSQSTNTQSPIPNIHLDEISQDLHALHTHLAALHAQIAALETAGVTPATPHWRKDQHGRPRLLYLLHPSHNGQRKREYIGADPAKQAQALARVQRYQQRDQLIHQANHLTARLAHLHHDLHDLHTAITELGEQCRTNELARCQTSPLPASPPLAGLPASSSAGGTEGGPQEQSQ